MFIIKVTGGPSAASATSSARLLYPLQLNLNERPRDTYILQGICLLRVPSHPLTCSPPASDTQIPLFKLKPISRPMTTPSDDDDTNHFDDMVRLRHDRQTTDSTNSHGLCTAKDGGDIPRSVYRDALYHKSDDREAELRSKIFEERWQEERLRMGAKASS